MLPDVALRRLGSEPHLAARCKCIDRTNAQFGEMSYRGMAEISEDNPNSQHHSLVCSSCLSVFCTGSPGTMRTSMDRPICYETDYRILRELDTTHSSQRRGLMPKGLLRRPCAIMRSCLIERKERRWPHILNCARSPNRFRAVAFCFATYR